MAKEALAKTLAKKKKKRWFPILAPAFLGGATLGETPAYEPAEVVNRCMNINLANLVGDMKRQGTYVQLKIMELDNGKCVTRVDRFELSPGSVKRLVKKGRTKIADSFVVKTQDEVFVRIKPLLITNTLTNRAVATNLRKGARMFSKEYCHATTFENIIQDLIRGNVQRLMKEKLSKLYPLRVADVQVFARETRTMRENVDEKGTDIVFNKPEDEESDDEQKEESPAEPANDEFSEDEEK